jgi:hypothetical protein
MRAARRGSLFRGGRLSGCSVRMPTSVCHAIIFESLTLAPFEDLAMWDSMRPIGDAGKRTNRCLRSVRASARRAWGRRPNGASGTILGQCQEGGIGRTYAADLPSSATGASRTSVSGSPSSFASWGHAKDTIARWATLGAKCFAELRGLMPST